MSSYPRWSEWRKWDLHLHTASSYDYKYKWKDADQVLINALKSNWICAVAITDHFWISKSRIENLRSLAPEIVFFPWVELRTDKWDINIHIILIFDDKCVLSSLCEDFNSFKRNKAKNLEDNDRIYWDFKDIIDFAESHWALISVHAWRKSNGVDTRITNALEVSQAIKEEYAKNVDIFEMWQLRDLNEYREHVFPSIWEKPMIICSDNHDPQDYSCNLWIKADLTFEWLKQIVYEPTERVKIQENLPEEKESYLVIDKVKFSDNSFSPDDILISKNLTTIIWWKSTWKSILLRMIAESIDKQEVEKRLAEAWLPQYEMKINKFNVFWNDGQTSNDNIEKKIIYIPQSYLNRITENWESKNAVIDMVVNILKNEKNVNKAFEDLDYQKKQLSQLLNKNIEDLFFSIEARQKCIEKIKNIWDKKWIKKEIENLEIKIEELKKTINLTEEELNKYNFLTKNISENNSKKVVITQVIEVYNKLLNFNNYFVLDSQIINCFSKCPKEYKEDLITEFNNYEILFINWVKETLLKKLNDIQKECDDLDKKIEDLNKEVLPLSEKIKKSEMLNQNINRLNEEKLKLAKIDTEEKLREDLRDKNNGLISEIIKNISSYYTILMNIKDDILKQKTITENNGLMFNIEVKFDFNKFQENFEKIVFDQRKVLSNDYKFGKDINLESFEKKLDILIKTILKGDELPIRPQFTKKEVLTKLAQSWFFFNYKISENGDELNQMSPWKKSYVLLKLLIELDSSKCPILLDQPEDDLDNRSIYQDLARFIKEKKKYRQFIIATHNPNLVIGTDAECVIVANQEWNRSKNRTYKFEYVQGALEDTKEPISTEQCILYKQWIQQHVCEILEWWEEAFEKRKKKYNFMKDSKI